MSKHCTGLRELRVPCRTCGASGSTFTHSLPVEITAAQRVSVIQSLSSLLSLDHLSFQVVSCSPELLALVDVTCKLLTHKLKRLDVYDVYPGGGLALGVLVTQWGRLFGLQQPSLHVHNQDAAAALSQVADACLVGMCGIQEVRMCLPDEASVAMVLAAADALAQVGLPKPGVVEVIRLV